METFSFTILRLNLLIKPMSHSAKFLTISMKLVKKAFLYSTYNNITKND